MVRVTASNLNMLAKVKCTGSLHTEVVPDDPNRKHLP